MSNPILLLEGVDGCGKSSVGRELLNLADQDGLSVTLVRDPGTTVFGEAMRDILADKRIGVEPLAQTLSFMAVRAQLAAWLTEHREIYDLIILDRYWHSTIAYQCFGGGANRDFVMACIREIDSMYPDAKLTLATSFLLDVPVEVAHERRMADAGRANERFKAADMDFKHRVAEGYQWLADEGFLTRTTVGNGDAEEGARRLYEQWTTACG